MDARRCISYLTIEHRSDIPAALQPLLGELIYGCDICQDVCPWNVRFATQGAEPAFAPRQVLADKTAEALAAELMAMEDEHFRSAFKSSPMKRPKLVRLKRNAAVVLENIRRAREPSSAVARESQTAGDPALSPIDENSPYYR